MVFWSGLLNTYLLLKQNKNNQTTSYLIDFILTANENQESELTVTCS